MSSRAQGHFRSFQFQIRCLTSEKSPASGWQKEGRPALLRRAVRATHSHEAAHTRARGEKRRTRLFRAPRHLLGRGAARSRRKREQTARRMGRGKDGGKTGKRRMKNTMEKRAKRGVGGDRVPPGVRHWVNRRTGRSFPSCLSLVRFSLASVDRSRRSGRDVPSLIPSAPFEILSPR